MPRKQLWSKPTVTGLYLANFKGFGPEGCHIPLRPLTLIYGPNSGGKSTILKGYSSIAQAKTQSMAEGAKQDWISEGPWFDLGSKKQVMHQGPGAKAGEFTIGYSGTFHGTSWSSKTKIKPEAWESGVPILNLCEWSEAMQEIERVFGYWEAEDYDSLPWPEGVESSSNGALDSIHWLPRVRDDWFELLEEDLQSYANEWPEGFEHLSSDQKPTSDHEDFEFLKSKVWDVLIDLATQIYNESAEVQADFSEFRIENARRTFFRALVAIHVSDIQDGKASLDLHYKEGGQEIAELNKVLDKLPASGLIQKHGFNRAIIDLKALRNAYSKEVDSTTSDPICRFSKRTRGTYGPRSLLMFDLDAIPHSMPDDSFYLLDHVSLKPRKHQAFAMGDKCNYNLEELHRAFPNESNISVVEEWTIENGFMYLRCNIESPSQQPKLSVGRIIKFENRLDLIFTHRAGGFSLKGFNFNEVRGGAWHKLISGKSTEWRHDEADKPGPMSLRPNAADFSVHRVKHHIYPDLFDPSELAADLVEIEQYKKATKIFARAIFPLLYDYTFDLEKNTLSVNEVRVPGGPRLTVFEESLRKLKDINYDSIIEMINDFYKEHNWTPLSVTEKKAIHHYCLHPPSTNTSSSQWYIPSHKVPWVFFELPTIIKPEKREISINDLSEEDKHQFIEGTVTRARFVSLFKISKKELAPRIAIPIGIEQPSSMYIYLQNIPHMLPNSFHSMYTRLYQMIGLVSKESNSIDYLSASRLSPRRYYAQADHTGAASVTGRTLGNLHSKFPRGSPGLAKLNELMTRIVGVEVSFGKLRSADGQDTNLLDVRVGKPGSRRKFAQLPDVGYGVSQTLPLVAAIVDTDEYSLDTTLVIEEAESNLHPAAQSRLMDAILENLNIEVPSPKILLETHSEHFLMTVQRHLKEGGLDIEDEDIAILYVDNDNHDDATEVHHMRTRKGDFLSPWPRENWDDPTSPII